MRSREAWARTAHDVNVYLMQDWAGGWAQHPRNDRHKNVDRSEALFPGPDAMRCSFLCNGLGDWAVITRVSGLGCSLVRTCEIWLVNYTVCRERVFFFHCPIVESDSIQTSLCSASYVRGQRSTARNRPPQAAR